MKTCDIQISIMEWPFNIPIGIMEWPLSATVYIPYSWKYWWSLNLAVKPKTKCKKYWWNIYLAVAPHSVLSHHKHCTRVYQQHCCTLV